MRYIAPVLFLVIVIAGCDPVKELDWDRTAKDQHLRIGNRVKVSALAYNLPVYEFKGFTDPDKVWVKKKWDTTLDLWTYNPDAPVDENDPHNPINPNALIGTVICTIYNPTYHPVLKPLRDTYPDAVKKGEYPTKRFRFEVIGRIHSFKRDTVPTGTETEPDISLTAVRIHVDSITLKE